MSTLPPSDLPSHFHYKDTTKYWYYQDFNKTLTYRNFNKTLTYRIRNCKTDSILSWVIRKGIEIMKTQKLNLGKNFTAMVSIMDLQRLGWEFDVEDTSKALKVSEQEAWDYLIKKYDVEITVDKNGRTFWNYVDTRKLEMGIFEGSGKELTGDDEQTIKDLQQLFEEGNLWGEKIITKN